MVNYWRPITSRSVGLLLLCTVMSPALRGGAWIRINQLGYLPGSVKVAVLASREEHPAPVQFEVLDRLTGRVVHTSSSIEACSHYGPFASTFRLDFSGLEREGSYSIRAGSTVSPPFRIARDVYDGAADFLLRYMRQQRCGFNPFLNDSCHTRDGYIIYHPTLDSTFIDVVGGWHDASDYLQYVATSANAVVQMLLAYEKNPRSFSDDVSSNGLPGPNGLPDILDEALWGLAWLQKMNPAPGMMFNQVADDRDHLGFRLPTEDTVSYGRGKERPVYFCTGTPQGIYKYQNRATGIASTAAKFASAFALGSDLLRAWMPARADTLARMAVAAYEMARRSPGVCQTAPCRAPYFYEEDNWVDDMELAATLLHRVTADPGMLQEAVSFGVQETVTPWMGAETARHYQWYPFVNLGHYQLAVRGGDSIRAAFLGYMKEGLERIRRRGAGNPFLFGVPFIWCSNNLVAAALTQARLYREASGDSSYVLMEAALRDWLFGCNPWGTSMLVGLPADGISPRDPHSAFSHLHGYAIDGGLVDGPVYGSIFSSLIGITLHQADEFAEFQSTLAVYHDDYGDYSTNEPTMDGTASLTYALSSLEREGGTERLSDRRVVSHGAVVRMDTTQKTIYLAFTGHEYADGGSTIRQVLHRHGAKASFFFTGDFYRREEFAQLIRGLARDGHYLGPHSDKHLLYADWDRRDSLLVTRAQFEHDLRGNLEAMAPFVKDPTASRVFMPPFEWYNDSIASWCRDLGMTLVNFTPGTRSNADYTYPEMGKQYVSTRTIYEGILQLERSSGSGLCGHIMLMHIGTDPRRKEKLYGRLDGLLGELRKRGYDFERLGP